mgnify:CR=1 FL=1
MEIIITAGLEFGLSPVASMAIYVVVVLSAAALVCGYCYGVARLLERRC